MRTSKDFQANPFGTLVDPAKLVSAYDKVCYYQNFLSVHILEFEPSAKIDPGTVL
ncbi:MAG: hypothetical protein L0H53_09105 [Candidatus Nitrosocosmicus sp.]|nr:hypothetical protein [Candidatus Nitrosocosmicus sp.]MDN5866538.1 hypothetical protein [Candidatus Nitrosocosmicus sp.]